MGYKQKGNDGWEGWDVNRKERMGCKQEGKDRKKQEKKDGMKTGRK